MLWSVIEPNAASNMSNEINGTHLPNSRRSNEVIQLLDYII